MNSFGQLSWWRPAAVAAVFFVGAPGWAGTLADDWRQELAAKACSHEIRSFTQLRNLAWSQFNRYGEVFHRASILYPEDPVSRGLYIRDLLGERSVGFVREPSRVVLLSGRTRAPVRLEDALRVKQFGHVRPGLAPVPLKAFNSVAYASRKDVGQRLERDPAAQETSWDCDYCGGPVLYRPLRFRPATRLMVSAKHGWTGPYSQGLRMQSILKVMNASRSEDRIAAVLDQQGLFVPASALAIDQPFHGSGSAAHSLADLDKLLAYEERWDQFLASHGKPLVEIARSGSTMTAAQRNFEYSESGGVSPLRAMVWIAPVHPNVGLEETGQRLVGWTRNALALVPGRPYQSQAQWNPLALSWFQTLAEQLSRRQNAWWKSEFPLGRKPTPVLILIGENDHETSIATRAWFKALADRFPNHVEYVEVKGAGHDPLATSERYDGTRVSTGDQMSARERATEVWKVIYRFLRKHVPEAVESVR